MFRGRKSSSPILSLWEEEGWVGGEPRGCIALKPGGRASPRPCCSAGAALPGAFKRWRWPSSHDADISAASPGCASRPAPAAPWRPARPTARRRGGPPAWGSPSTATTPPAAASSPPTTRGGDAGTRVAHARAHTPHGDNGCGLAVTPPRDGDTDGDAASFAKGCDAFLRGKLRFEAGGCGEG